MPLVGGSATLSRQVSPSARRSFQISSDCNHHSWAVEVPDGPALTSKCLGAAQGSAHDACRSRRRPFIETELRSFWPKRCSICPRFSKSAKFHVAFSTVVCIVLRGRNKPVSQVPANVLYRSFQLLPVPDLLAWLQTRVGLSYRRRIAGEFVHRVPFRRAWRCVTRVIAMMELIAKLRKMLSRLFSGRRKPAPDADGEAVTNEIGSVAR